MDSFLVFCFVVLLIFILSLMGSLLLLLLWMGKKCCFSGKNEQQDQQEQHMDESNYEDICQMSCHIDKEDFYIDDNYSDMEELGKEQISTAVKNNVEPFLLQVGILRKIIIFKYRSVVFYCIIHLT